jgi:hypothetical protein
VTLCSRSLGTPTGLPRRPPFSAGLSLLSISGERANVNFEKGGQHETCTVNDNAQAN